MEIFKVLGTPTEKEWPGISKMKHYNIEIPLFKGTGLEKKGKGCLNH
jgi:hypothetical protein